MRTPYTEPLAPEMPTISRLFVMSPRGSTRLTAAASGHHPLLAAGVHDNAGSDRHSSGLRKRGGAGIPVSASLGGPTDAPTTRSTRRMLVDQSSLSSSGGVPIGPMFRPSTFARTIGAA